MVLTTVRTQFQFGLITCVPDIFQVHVSKVKSGQIPHPQSSSRVGPIISLKALAVGVERGETKRIFFQRNDAFTFCLSTFPSSVGGVSMVWRRRLPVHLSCILPPNASSSPQLLYQVHQRRYHHPIILLALLKCIPIPSHRTDASF